MKNILLLSFLSCISGIFAQESSHNISLGVSNNRQLGSTVEKLYVNNQIFQLPSSSSTAFKINAEYSFKSKKDLEFGITAGYAQMNGKYEINSNKGKISQQYYGATLFLLKVWSFDRIQLSTGAGIPLYFISDFQDINTANTTKITQTTDGGIAVGINNITRLKFNITNRLSLVTAVSFGVVHMDMGDQYRFLIEAPNGIVQGSGASKHSATIISAPEFSFGIGFKI